MAVSVVLSEIQRDTLTRVCDTFAPSLEAAEDPTGFWGRAASELGIPNAIEQMLATLPEDQVQGLRELLDALHAQGFGAAPQEAREQILHGFMDSGPEALAGVSAFRGLTLMLFYAIPDPATGTNPNWEAIGYPGPRSAPPSPDQAPKTIAVTRPVEDAMTLEADVVVVGSGAGGGVIAGKLAGAGKQVAVLEMGGYHNEADFNQLELWAYENLYRGGGVTATDDGGIALMAGSNLGGGTTVNWTNCLRTTPAVREEWEREHGLEGLTGAGYDAHLDAVSERINVTGECSDYNGPQLRLQEACRAAGYDFQQIVRNTDPERYDPENAGLIGFGDQSGSKQGTLKTYLQDAADAGAQFVVNCRAERILTENGRAAGVEGTYTDADGHTARVVVRAPAVVVACGSLESPALLLRSGIGGPAAGDYLRLHPATAVAAFYDEPQQGWWGAPQTGLSREFADLEGGYGFLVECSHASPGVTGSATPWESGRQHKEMMARGPQSSAFVLLIRDRGHGRVTIDADGNAVHSYAMTDPLDERHFRRGLAELCNLHALAGANEIVTFHRKLTRWRRGEDIEAFKARVHDAALSPYEHATFALHQMGSCRMGADPATSVANGWGELHDTPGVWIGDASAFPTASGTNPMLTTMALASRTAEAIAAA
ncbi:MAG: FAD-dependent oxidoreductase [Solirubrobacteraceae bacterium]